MLVAVSDPNPIGQILDGRYRIDELLGRGGMGNVYEATHLVLDRKVAIKTLHPQFARDERFRARFVREAKAASRIQHRNVVQIMDFGETADGCVFFVMEYLRGRDLRAVLRERKKLPWPRVRHILLQATSALGVAHKHGIIHRDIKPANCFLYDLEMEGLFDVVKLLDFGIAKVAMESEGGERSGNRLTGTGEIFGTSTYMAPEQARGDPLDARSDIYSLGIMTYEMLAGRPPFDGINHIHVIARHLSDAPQPPRQLEPSIPTAVEQLILGAIAKKPRDRPRSMEALHATIVGISERGTSRESGAGWAADPRASGGRTQDARARPRSQGTPRGWFPASGETVVDRVMTDLESNAGWAVGRDAGSDASTVRARLLWGLAGRLHPRASGSALPGAVTMISPVEARGVEDRGPRTVISPSHERPRSSVDSSAVTSKMDPAVPGVPVDETLVSPASAWPPSAPEADTVLSRDSAHEEWRADLDAEESTSPPPGQPDRSTARLSSMPREAESGCFTRGAEFAGSPDTRPHSSIERGGAWSPSRTTWLVTGASIVMGVLWLVLATVMSADEGPSSEESAWAPAEVGRPPGMPLSQFTETSPVEIMGDVPGSTTEASLDEADSDLLIIEDDDVELVLEDTASDGAMSTTGGPDTMEQIATAGAAETGDDEEPRGGNRRAVARKHETRACERHRQRTVEAVHAMRWTEVLGLTERRSCWGYSSQSQRREMNVTALLQLGRFEECIEIGRGTKNPRIAKAIETCEKMLGR